MGWPKGRKQSLEHRAKTSRSLQGNTRSLGHRHSPETRAKMSAASKGNTRALGYRHTLEARARISAAGRGNTHGLGYRFTPEQRTALSATRMGHPVSSETRAKISAHHALPIGSTRPHNRGYTLVKVAQPNVWELEHRAVAGLEPGDGRVAHHEDGSKLHNDPTNLRVFESQGEHRRYHGGARRALGG